MLKGRKHTASPKSTTFEHGLEWDSKVTAGFLLVNAARNQENSKVHSKNVVMDREIYLDGLVLRMPM